MEIKDPLTTTPDQECLIDMHSVLNVMNVVVFELLRISDLVAEPEELTDLIDAVRHAADLLRDPDEAHRQVENIESFIALVERTLDNVCVAPNLKAEPEIAAARANLASIFSVLRVRAREIVARHASPTAWVTHDVAQLKENFVQVFQAIERNSRGRYRIVHNLAEHDNGDYLINFTITSAAGNSILMPAIFQDVMRDLLANARKYTQPGGRIDAGLHNSGTELRFVVIDSGIGIPADEIALVVGFGHRAANAGAIPTRGGGFGLTKAWYVTQRFGGRMWIDSPLPQGGTRIEIRIPVPTGTASPSPQPSSDR